MTGAIRQATGAFPPALLAVGLCAFVGGIAIFVQPRRTSALQPAE